MVRASETVEGRGRLYRSRRAATAPPMRCAPRPCSASCPDSGSGPTPTRAAIVQTIAQRSGQDPEAVRHTLFGPPPATDTDLVNLAHALDNIERQVAQS